MPDGWKSDLNQSRSCFTFPFVGSCWSRLGFSFWLGWENVPALFRRHGNPISRGTDTSVALSFPVTVYSLVRSHFFGGFSRSVFGWLPLFGCLSSAKFCFYPAILLSSKTSSSFPLWRQLSFLSKSCKFPHNGLCARNNTILVIKFDTISAKRTTFVLVDDDIVWVINRLG